MTTSQSDECSVCQKPHPWPDGTTPKHPFTPAGSSVGWLGTRNRDSSPQRGSQGPQMTAIDQSWPFDPVLRQALIDKGVLTPDDLRAAEAKIRDISVIFNQGGSSGQSAEGPRGR